MTTETAIKSIKSKLSQLDSVHNSSEYYDWNLSMVSTLEIICPNNSIVKSVRGINSVGWNSDETSSAKKTAKTLLNSLINDLETFGIENIDKKSSQNTDKGVNVSVNQNNNQTQSTNVSIDLNFLVEILKDELKGAQVKELRAIIESDEEPEVKKKSFIEKIKSFGSDVASNILANLLTNPQVYSQLSGML